MDTELITIRVDAKAAKVFRSASAGQQRKLEALVSLQLLEATQSGDPLKNVIHDISQKAQERGLTPEILQSILDEE